MNPRGDCAQRDYRLAGVPLRLTAASADELAPVTAWFEVAFDVAAADGTAAAIALRVRTADRPAQADEGGHPPPVAAACRIRRRGAQVQLRLAEATCRLDLAAVTGELWLTPGFWNQACKRRQEPWLLSLAWLLRERDRYTLHAGAVARHGQGLLIAGDSGSGKSTTALNLIRQGWDYLADDAILLEPGPPPRLWALASGFACPPGLAALCPELTGPSVDGKRFVDLRDAYPGRRRRSCGAAALLFPTVTPRAAHSHLEPLTATESLLALLPASGGLVTDREHAATQLPVLRRLAETVPGYRLLAGRDSLRDGKPLEALLAAHGLLPGDPPAPPLHHTQESLRHADTR